MSALDPDRRRRWALGVICMTRLVIVLDARIVDVALPRAQLEPGMSDAERQCVVTAYVLTFGSLLLLGMLGFGAASVVGGLADTATRLIVARGVQGALAALLAPAALSMLTVLFTSGTERATGFAVFGIAAGPGASIGPALGGVITEVAGRRWCLLLNTVFAVLGVVGAAPFIRSDSPSGHKGHDLLGALLITLGFGSLVLGRPAPSTGGSRPTRCCSWPSACC